MNKIAIVTDNNSGISPEEAKKLNIFLIKMPILVNGEEYFEYDNLSQEQFFNFLKNNADVKTSQPSPGSVLTMWDNLLKVYNEIIYMPMSSGLSNSTSSAKVFATNSKYVNKVFVVDNHRISVTLKRAVLDAINLVKSGRSAKEIKHILEENKMQASIYIMVDTLKYLKKGGRITAAGAALGATFHIKPVLEIDGGKLDAKSKEIGVKKAKSAMINFAKQDLIKKFKLKDDYSSLQFDVAYTYDKDAAIIFAEEIKKAIDGITISNIDSLSLSVATHIGPGALAIAISKKIE